MIQRYLLCLLALWLPASALANDLEGAWALRIDEATIFRFEIEQGSDGEWRGSWTRPDSFASNGMVFSRLEGSEQLASMTGLEFAGDIELSFDDPRPGAIPDIFRFRHMGAGRAQLTYVGTDLPPYPLVRVAPDAPLGPFIDGRIYDRDNAQTISADAQAVSSGPAPEITSEPILDSGFPGNLIDDQAPRIGEDFLEGL